MNSNGQVLKSIFDRGVDEMTTANQLVRHIALQRQGLEQLEKELKKLQAACVHQFVETPTYRMCEKCNKVESVHY